MPLFPFRESGEVVSPQDPFHGREGDVHPFLSQPMQKDLRALVSFRAELEDAHEHRLWYLMRVGEWPGRTRGDYHPSIPWCAVHPLYDCALGVPKMPGDPDRAPSGSHEPNRITPHCGQLRI